MAVLVGIAGSVAAAIVLARRSSTTRRRSLAVRSAFFVVGGIFATLVFGLSAVLAANECGAFGDACDADGEASPWFIALALGAVAGVGLTVTGVVIGIQALTDRD